MSGRRKMPCPSGEHGYPHWSDQQQYRACCLRAARAVGPKARTNLGSKRSYVKPRHPVMAETQDTERGMNKDVREVRARFLSPDFVPRDYWIRDNELPGNPMRIDPKGCGCTDCATGDSRPSVAADELAQQIFDPWKERTILNASGDSLFAVARERDYAAEDDPAHEAYDFEISATNPRANDPGFRGAVVKIPFDYMGYTDELLHGEERINLDMAAGDDATAARALGEWDGLNGYKPVVVMPRDSRGYAQFLVVDEECGTERDYYGKAGFIAPDGERYLLEGDESSEVALRCTTGQRDLLTLDQVSPGMERAAAASLGNKGLLYARSNDFPEVVEEMARLYHRAKAKSER